MEMAPLEYPFMAGNAHKKSQVGDINIGKGWENPTVANGLGQWSQR